MTFTVDNWPKVQAANYKNTNGRTVRLVVIHDMEAPESGTTAESVAKYFASGKVEASAHLCIDNNSIIRGVNDNDVAYAAPGANSDGLQIENAGYARQTRVEWLDVYSRAVLENCAKATAQYCVKFGLPVKRLTVSEVLAGQKGIVGHVDVSQAYKKSTHSDPGPTFPWDYFIGRVQYWYPYYKNNRTWPTKPTAVVANTVTKIVTIVTGKYTVDNLKRMQAAAHLTTDGIWGNGTDQAFSVLVKADHSTEATTRKLQVVTGSTVDGVWGPQSEAHLVQSVKVLQQGLKVTATGKMDAASLDAFKKARAQFYRVI